MLVAAKILAALLSYPTEESRAALPEIAAALAADRALPTAAREPLAGLVAHLGAGELLDRQDEYVRLFDRTRSLALNLFEHVHGDGRERGPAMVALRGIYAGHGLEPDPRELPDFLPIMLEFAALCPEPGCRLLADAAPVIDRVRARLAARGTPYAAALAAVLALAGGEAAATATAEEAAEDSAEAIDRAWAEAPVSFGPDTDPAREAAAGASCGIGAVMARLEAAKTAEPAMRRPPAS